jgi:O-succinylbenzoic acid--CoA ligase
VERAVQAVAGLEQAVVVAVDDPQWGQVPVVVTDRGRSVELGELRARLADRLGRAAAPAEIIEVDEVPRLASGKPDRVAVARLVGGAGQ